MSAPAACVRPASARTVSRSPRRRRWPSRAERLFDAFVDDAARARWLPDDRLRERTATKPRSARFDWAGGATRVNVGFEPKGEAKSTVALEHARLGDAGEAERMKAYWRERLSALKSQLEGGEIDA